VTKSTPRRKRRKPEEGVTRSRKIQKSKKGPQEGAQKRNVPKIARQKRESLKSQKKQKEFVH